jgi:hypothetical protein
VFPSHRWGAPDDNTVKGLFELLSDYVLNKSPVSVFYNSEHMKDAHRFDREFLML